MVFSVIWIGLPRTEVPPLAIAVKLPPLIDRPGKSVRSRRAMATNSWYGRPSFKSTRKLAVSGVPKPPTVVRTDSTGSMVSRRASISRAFASVCASDPPGGSVRDTSTAPWSTAGRKICFRNVAP